MPFPIHYKRTLIVPFRVQGGELNRGPVFLWPTADAIEGL
jgi:hypothetical protein